MTHLISHFYKPNVKANVKSNYYDVQLTVLGQLKDLNSGSNIACRNERIHYGIGILLLSDSNFEI